MAETSAATPWRVSGSYYEACNCEAICPCRRQGDRPGGRSTFGVCDFALSWAIVDGHAGPLDLSGLDVVMVGSYSDDEPGSPWRVALYVDEQGSAAQQDALAAIFLGKAGGTTLKNFAAAIGEVYAVRTASIQLDHRPGRERFDVDASVTVIASELVATEMAVSCGIPGHDRAGHEMIASVMRVDEPPLSWEVRGRCSYVATFDYASDLD